MECRERLDLTLVLSTVSCIVRDVDFPCGTFLHVSQSLSPTLDHTRYRHLDVVALVECLAIDGLTVVADLSHILSGRSLTGTSLYLFIIYAVAQWLYARHLCNLCHVGFALLLVRTVSLLEVLLLNLLSVALEDFLSLLWSHLPSLVLHAGSETLHELIHRQSLCRVVGEELRVNHLLETHALTDTDGETLVVGILLLVAGILNASLDTLEELIDVC